MDGDVSAGEVLREARTRAALTQQELGQRAGVTQSVISAYESGSRQPSVPTLRRLVEATGSRLELRVAGGARSVERADGIGELGRRVLDHRDEIRRLAGTYGASNVRLFGSAARGRLVR